MNIIIEVTKLLDYLKEIIQEICDEKMIQYSTLSKDWMIRMEKEGKVAFIVGSKFSINSDTASKIASDKYATYCVLREANIPVIEHKILFHPIYRSKYPSDLKNEEEIINYFQKCYEKVVVKPNDGSEGKNVYLCKTTEEIFENVKRIFERKESLSICPYYDIVTEYRAIMLDYECQLLFGKRKAQDNWKFNLSQGASVVEVENQELQYQLISLAQKVTMALQIRFASVDMIQLQTGELMVIEVNSGVTIHQYTKFVENGRKVAKEIYTKAIEKMLE